MYGIIIYYKNGNKEGGKMDEKDDFWDIEKLIPKKEKPKYTPPVRDTEAVLITDDARQSSQGEAVVHRIIPKAAEKDGEEQAPADEYSPKSPLISKVQIYKWRNSYNYYEQFCIDARRFARLHGEVCEHVPYFSYVPQYVQLSGAQMRWYLYWRDRVFAGEYPKTDYSYILLLIFEIINLAEAADTKKGQRVLCELWLNYRGEYPRLDRYLCEWICDYSIIHRLPPPLGFCDSGIAEYCTLKEFYVYYDERDSHGYARALIKFCSAYDYHKSKFAQGEALKIFDAHVAGALSFVLERCSEPGKILSAAGLEDNTIVRDSYNGALCASQVKRRIVVSFFSFSRSHELRFLIADIIKYSENKIRAAIGVKSRLSVFTLPDPVRTALDEYFSLNLKKNTEILRKEKPKEEYEKLYDAPKTELSPENAAKIENSSWQVTKILIEAFDGEEEKQEPIIEEKPIEKEVCESADSPARELENSLGERYDFLVAALESDAGKQAALANKLGVMADALADEINDIAAEIIGDIILEDQGGYYTVIEDYREIFENE